MRTCHVVTIMCCLLLGKMSPAANANQSFTVTPLPQWRQMELTPRAMNDRGQVVGVAGTEQHHLLLWERDKGFVDLGSASYPGQFDINNHGQICGNTESEPKGYPQAFLREPDGTVQTLGHLGDHASFAKAINNRGQIVGCSFTGLTNRAFVWDRENGMRELPTPKGARSEATAVSDLGQIFGSVEVGHGTNTMRHPYYWEPTADAGYLRVKAPDSNFFSMSDRGWVIGKYFFMKDGPHATVWQGHAGIRKLFPIQPDKGFFERSTWKVNDADQVVCIAENRINLSTAEDIKHNDAEHSRFFWDPTEGKTPLDVYMPSGTCQFTVLDLNNQGCILGIAHMEDGGNVPLLLEPTPARD